VAEILVVDDDTSMATAFQHFLTYEGHSFRIASDAEDALRLMKARTPDITIMDIRMPGRDGLQTLAEMRGLFPDVYVVMMTAYGTSQTSIDAIRAGAFDYLTKPLDLDQLRAVIAKALAAQRIREKAQPTQDDTGASHALRLVGESAAMRDVYKMIGRLATNDVPAMVVGEHGSGKELVVRTIHDNSARRDAPFVSIDCTAMPESALESALFATAGGTRHIANIGSLTPMLQARLARALNDRPGATSCDRILASSERNLSDDVRAGTFHHELLDALSVITLHIPPLRDRRDDIPGLVWHFIQRFNDELNRAIKGVDDEVSARLHAYSWPGNVGELERVVKRACIVASSDVLTADDLGTALADGRFEPRDVASSLPASVRTALHERLVERSANPEASPFHDIVDLVEATLVAETLAITHGNQVKAAEILGVNRATIRKKMPSES
jgi:two-component system nitrogen regulation response regulator GlnG